MNDKKLLQDSINVLHDCLTDYAETSIGSDQEAINGLDEAWSTIVAALQDKLK